MRLFTVFLLFLPLCLPAQDNLQYAALLIPPDLLENANAVVRQQEVVFTVKSAREATLREKRAVTLFNDNSHYDLLVLHYDNYNKLGKIKGRVYDRNGRFVREIGKSEVRDQSAISSFSIYEDNRVRYVDVDYKEFPYTVEFEYDMTYKELFHYPSWGVDEFGAAVQSATFSLDLPPGFMVYHKILNLEAEHTQADLEKSTTHRWAVHNLPAVKKEPYTPPVLSLLPRIMVSPDVFEVEQYRGSMASWQTFGQFMGQLANGRDELSPDMKAKVAELTADAGSDREKIAALYRYLQQNMRYVSVQLGIGGWQPFDAKYVEQNKYGDCKALSNFMKAMLKEAGIVSYPVLIDAGEVRYEVTEDFTNPLFNHMILHVPSENFWLECTSNTAPLNYLSNWTSDRNVLLITENGGTLARTPPRPVSSNAERNEVSIALQADGQAVIEVQSLSRGSKHDWFRYAVHDLSKEELEKKFQERLSLPGFTYQKLAISPDPNTPEATLHFKAAVPRFASLAGKRLFLPANAFNPLTDVPPVTENRRHPVVLRNGYSEQDIITFSLPQGFDVESTPPADFVLDTPYGNYRIKTTKGEGTVTIERWLEVRPVSLPASEYGPWRDFFREIAKMDGAKMVLVEKKT